VRLLRFRSLVTRPKRSQGSSRFGKAIGNVNHGMMKRCPERQAEGQRWKQKGRKQKNPYCLTPRWLKLERFFVAASGLSLCGAIAVWITGKADFPFVGPALRDLTFSQGAFAVVAVAVPHAGELLSLVRSHGRRTSHLVIFVMSLIVGAFSGFLGVVVAACFFLSWGEVGILSLILPLAVVLFFHCGLCAVSVAAAARVYTVPPTSSLN